MNELRNLLASTGHYGPILFMILWIGLSALVWYFS